MELRPDWSNDYRNERYSGPASLAIHAIAIAALLLLGGRRVLTDHPHDRPGPIFIPSDMSLYLPHLPLAKPGDQSGGGGGNRSPTPASKGDLPRFAPEQFTPPSAVLLNDNPALPMEPTLLATIDIKRLPDFAGYGSPTGVAGPPSNGPGSRGGIGGGNRGGVGDGNGPSFGDDPGGILKGVWKPGNGVTLPEVISRVEPEFTDAARKAKHQGTVTVSIVVDATGHVIEAHVVNALGMGLDEKALEAVKQWKFRPGTKDGKAVAVYAAIAVTFRLL